MSKYRIELKPSRILIVFQLLTYAVLVSSVFSWQSNVIANQIFVQAVITLVSSFFIFRSIYQSYTRSMPVIIFSQQGEWLELGRHEQTTWQLTKSSRVTGLLLFVHLASQFDLKRTKRHLIYRDQLNEQDFRRLCRTILYQQQLSDKH